LRAAGVHVVVHDDRFPPGTVDEVWLAEAGRQNWFVLTKDRRIRYRQIERRALELAGVGAFVLTGKDLTGEEMAQAIVKALPKIRRLAKKTPRPFIATITTGGTVARLA
jgi:5S rRNA maturation endonuclease (ribonuclease M5)